jgi:hypothetical protein
MRLFAVFLLLIVLPVASAQEGLFVSQHNVTYILGETDFLAEEVIVFEYMGSESGNLFNDNIYFIRGDAREVEVSAAEEDLKYSVEYLDSTVININFMLWRGEKKVVTLKYRRSDMLFSEDNVHSINGLALGKYTWVADRATIKFKAPAEFQFGIVVPPAVKTIENSSEVLTYNIAPIDLENLTAIKEGIPVSLEYAKFDELAIVETATAREFIEDGESDIKSANKSVENAMEHVSDTTQVLTLFEIASTRLAEAKNSLDLAEIKSNQYSEEYSPYEAYYYAKHSRNLSREASRRAEEAKDLANYEIQKTLEGRISGIGSKLREQTDIDAVDGPADTPVTEEKPWKGYGLALMLVLAAVVVFDIYRRSGGHKSTATSKKSKVRDFRAIDELKHKSFKGFDKKLDTVKHGTEIAAEIRDLRKRKEELESQKDKLQRKMEREEIPQHQFEIEREKLDREINEASTEIDGLKSRLDELKRVNR